MSVSGMPESGAAVGVPWASAVCAGIRAAGCRWVVHVPDNPLAHVLRTLEDEHPEVRTIVATREEEAFGIAAGLYLGGERAAVMLQSSGLGNSLNALGSLLVAYHIPALMVMSMRGGPGEWNEAQVPVGRAVPSFLDAIGVQYTTADTAAGAQEAVRLAGSLAFGTRTPAACLLTRSLTATGHRMMHTGALGGTTAALPQAKSDGNRTATSATPAVLMNRLDATRIVVQTLHDEPVVASLGHPAYDLFAVGDRAANFYTWGSMGMASSVGLGVALARPDRRVIVLDGDGSLLMNLGALATIGVTSPRNLTLIVWDNGAYGTTGGQRSATAYGANLAQVAGALGIPVASTVHTARELIAALDGAAGGSGPAVIVAKVTESGAAVKPPLDCVFLKHRFMTALGSADPATRGGGA